MKGELQRFSRRELANVIAFSDSDEFKKALASKLQRVQALEKKLSKEEKKAAAEAAKLARRAAKEERDAAKDKGSKEPKAAKGKAAMLGFSKALFLS